ncbi:MAG: hypothetical protein Fur0018_16270 [Anaerolineales bacterium]
MQNSPAAGYREIEHTADWALEVWAPDIASLLRTAAAGMYALAGARAADAPHITRQVMLTAPDAEGLLVVFLEELLYLAAEEHWIFEPLDVQVDIRPDDLHLVARLHGAPLAALKKEIKAVTWHNLCVRRSARGLETTLVFDV